MLLAQCFPLRCIRCAFRARQLALQAQRQRHTTVSPRLVSKYVHSRDRKSATYRPLRFVDPPHSVRKAGRGDKAERVEVTFKGFMVDRETEEGFHNILHDRLKRLRTELESAPLLEQLRKEQRDNGERVESFSRLWKTFSSKLIEPRAPASLPWVGALDDADDPPHNASTLRDLREAYRARGIPALDARIKYAFYAHVTNARFTESDLANQRALADLRYPSEWFPGTRSLHRAIHLHVGPTNSGKTHQALQRLEQARRGIYCGPLRLLAHEVYARLNAKGKPCALVTGDERRAVEDADKLGDVDMSSCTIEMMPLNKRLDVAVIDEIQMIGNAERGWAWTQALLGVRAREVHLCGEERSVPLIREICASLGEKLEVHKYERLSPLHMAGESLNGDLRRLRKGDCVVSFSVMGIHALRQEIEKLTGRKVATVYGSLPPETRAQQARLFNDPNNEYDILVASDAVGMGLNLAIKRIVFETASKWDGRQRRTLAVADIKQIAGRAGRYRVAGQPDPSSSSSPPASHPAAPGSFLTAPPSPEGETVGFVTTIEHFDYPIVAAAMSAEPEPIRSAGLFPPAAILERFASYFPPRTPFSYILTRLHELSQMHPRFHLCGLRDQLFVADLIEPVQGLTTLDRNAICSAPVSPTEDMWRSLMPAFARCISNQSGGALTDIAELPLETLEKEPEATREYLRELERLHKGIVNYLWLSYRFAGIFTTRGLAFHVKSMVEERIEMVLGKFSFTEEQRRKMAERREKEILRQMVEVKDLEREDAAPNGGKVKSDGERRHVIAGQREVDCLKGNTAGQEAVVDVDPQVEEQTSLTAGGDRFAGEEDFNWEEPEDEELVKQHSDADSTPRTGGAAAAVDDESHTTNVSPTWRTQRTLKQKLAPPEMIEVKSGDAASSASAEKIPDGTPSFGRSDITLSRTADLDRDSTSMEQSVDTTASPRAHLAPSSPAIGMPLHQKQSSSPQVRTQRPATKLEARASLPDGEHAQRSTSAPNVQDPVFGDVVPAQSLAPFNVPRPEVEGTVASRP